MSCTVSVPMQRQGAWKTNWGCKSLRDSSVTIRRSTPLPAHRPFFTSLAVLWARTVPLVPRIFLQARAVSRACRRRHFDVWPFPP
jgi:hypothetical protein